MNVLVDRHHAGLYHSIQMLGDRLGWNVYTPAGILWWDNEYWNFGRSHWGDDRLAQQFLNPDQPRCDPEFPDLPVNTVTLPQALEMTWDVVMATTEDNQLGFYRFAKERGAKYAVHVGNTNQYVAWNLEPLVLNASEMPGGIHIGEEFDSTGLFAYAPPEEHRSTSSFVNCMTSIACYPLLEQASELGLPIHVYGIDGPDGVLKPIDLLASTMKASGWAWHDKEHGDGFGHVLHYWAAIGRPLIGHASHYRGKNGSAFWLDGITCIDLDKHSVLEAVSLVNEISADPARHEAMCRAIRAIFDETVDWQRDAERVADLLA